MYAIGSWVTFVLTSDVGLWSELDHKSLVMLRSTDRHATDTGLLYETFVARGIVGHASTSTHDRMQILNPWPQPCYT